MNDDHGVLLKRDPSPRKPEEGGAGNKRRWIPPDAPPGS